MDRSKPAKKKKKTQMFTLNGPSIVVSGDKLGIVKSCAFNCVCDFYFGLAWDIYKQNLRFKPYINGQTLKSPR